MGPAPLGAEIQGTFIIMYRLVQIANPITCRQPCERLTAINSCQCQLFGKELSRAWVRGLLVTLYRLIEIRGPVTRGQVRPRQADIVLYTDKLAREILLCVNAQSGLVAGDGLA